MKPLGQNTVSHLKLILLLKAMFEERGPLYGWWSKSFEKMKAEEEHGSASP